MPGSEILMLCRWRRRELVSATRALMPRADPFCGRDKCTSQPQYREFARCRPAHHITTSPDLCPAMHAPAGRGGDGCRVCKPFHAPFALPCSFLEEANRDNFSKATSVRSAIMTARKRLGRRVSLARTKDPMPVLASENRVRANHGPEPGFPWCRR